MRRLFFAAWPSDDWRAQLAGAVAPRFTDLTALGGRMHADVDWHLTLCFLGAVDEALLAPLCRYAGDIELPSFRLNFDCLQYWRKPRAVVMTTSQSIVPPAGERLVNALVAAASAVGLQPDVRPWLPHLTLARAVAPKCWAQQSQDTQLRLPAMPWSVDAFHLAESRFADGHRYQSLASWPLRKVAS